jgi:hypothetical protein
LYQVKIEFQSNDFDEFIQQCKDKFISEKLLLTSYT